METRRLYRHVFVASKMGMTVRLVLSFLSFLLVLSSAREADAHAALVDSSPRAAEVLAESPRELILHFNENVGPIYFRIVDKTGREVGKPGEIRTDGNDVILPLGETLPHGSYVISYRVVSLDTHPVGEAFSFAVGVPLADRTILALPASGVSAWNDAVIGNRWALYTLMLLAAGSALFFILMRVPEAVAAVASRLGSVAAVLGIVSYFLSVGLGGAEMVGGTVGVLLAPAPWKQGASTTLGPSALIGIPAMLILFTAFRPAKPSQLLLMIGVALAIGSFLVTGHAATAAPQWLMASMVSVHLLCIAFWFGSLAPLLRAARVLPVVEAGRVMTQFSMRAVFTVPALFSSGVAIAWVQLGSLKALLDPYGQRLLIKLALFAAILALAGYNKFRLTPKLERGEEVSSREMRRSISIEYALFVLILGAAALLTQVPPPRAAIEASQLIARADQGFRRTVAAEGYQVDLEVTPARPGPNTLNVTVKDASGQRLKLASITMRLSLPVAGIIDVEKRGQAAGDGMWHFEVDEMIVPGDWDVRVSAYVTDFDKVNFDLKVPIGNEPRGF